MSYTGEDVRRLAEAYLQETRRCDEARHVMVKEFIERVREIKAKKGKEA